ncbi:hypothetical protein [Xanthomonas albilineans]|uniref:Probable xsa-associated protein n=2 Tax=Xanthomonas albilineans TaxID=29447 RepID=D2UDP2_XANAP|nr:hypothetical protein [Xanthomonas albilineans]CBA16011.1 probable xsa-associated protein [Xanthomonas albilineans GPE PC73]
MTVNNCHTSLQAQMPPYDGSEISVCQTEFAAPEFDNLLASSVASVSVGKPIPLEKDSLYCTRNHSEFKLSAPGSRLSVSRDRGTNPFRTETRGSLDSIESVKGFQQSSHNDKETCSPTSSDADRRLDRQLSTLAQRKPSDTPSDVSVTNKGGVLAAKEPTVPDASLEEIEQTMIAFAYLLIAQHGGVKSVEAVKQLNDLLNNTASNSATRRYLRDFFYALHMLDVPSICDPKDATHINKRSELVKKFIKAINMGASLHAQGAEKADKVYKGLLDLNSSGGTVSHKAWSDTWAALNDALHSHSGKSYSEMKHMEEYYKQHVEPRVRRRAQFVYCGDIKDNPNALVASGAWSASWNIVQGLMCAKAVNPMEKGQALAHACQTLHKMPDFLRLPQNNQKSQNNQDGGNRHADSPVNQAGGVRSDAYTPTIDNRPVNIVKGSKIYLYGLKHDADRIQSPMVNRAVRAEHRNTGSDLADQSAELPFSTSQTQSDSSEHTLGTPLLNDTSSRPPGSQVAETPSPPSPPSPPSQLRQTDRKLSPDEESARRAAPPRLVDELKNYSVTRLRKTSRGKELLSGGANPSTSLTPTPEPGSSQSSEGSTSALSRSSSLGLSSLSPSRRVILGTGLGTNNAAELQKYSI